MNSRNGIRALPVGNFLPARQPFSADCGLEFFQRIGLETDGVLEAADYMLRASCHMLWHCLPVDIYLSNRTTRLNEAFGAAPACGLEALASGFLHEPLPPTFVFWRGVAQRLFTALCHK